MRYLSDETETHSFLLLEPNLLLILQQERVPRLFHIQITTTHFE